VDIADNASSAVSSPWLRSWRAWRSGDRSDTATDPSDQAKRSLPDLEHGTSDGATALGVSTPARRNAMQAAVYLVLRDVFRCRTRISTPHRRRPFELVITIRTACVPTGNRLAPRIGTP